MRVHHKLGGAEAAAEERKHHSRCMKSEDENGQDSCSCLCSADKEHLSSPKEEL
jgi:hypothetical protein